MLFRLLTLVFRNLFRAKTRTFITVFGCMTGAFIIAFFMTAQYSLGAILVDVEDDANVIVKQKDRY